MQIRLFSHNDACVATSQRQADAVAEMLLLNRSKGGSRLAPPATRCGVWARNMAWSLAATTHAHTVSLSGCFLTIRAARCTWSRCVGRTDSSVQRAGTTPRLGDRREIDWRVPIAVIRLR